MNAPAVASPSPTLSARPFLKWAGGKSQLLEQIAAHYPAALHQGDLTRYVEPFLGSGAVFLAVAQRFPIRHAYLTDINPELVLVYRVVQQDVERLIDRLSELARHHLAGDPAARAAHYYAVRDQYNDGRGQVDWHRYGPGWIDRAALMLFLNKTCYNGLFRVNRGGGYNVPFGRYAKPAIYDAANLRRVAELLQRAEIAVAPFAACRGWVDATTFVYFDPPYRPLTPTSNFTAYSAHKFGDEEQIALAAFYGELHDTTGAKLMLSNSDPGQLDPPDPFFANLYARFVHHRVWASRMINTRADKRGKISELLITNYTE